MRFVSFIDQGDAMSMPLKKLIVAGIQGTSVLVILSVANYFTPLVSAHTSWFLKYAFDIIPLLQVCISIFTFINQLQLFFKWKKSNNFDAEQTEQ